MIFYFIYFLINLVNFLLLNIKLLDNYFYSNNIYNNFSRAIFIIISSYKISKIYNSSLYYNYLFNNSYRL